MHPAVAKNEYVVVTTSSPGPIPSAIIAASSASVPEDTVTASGDLEVLRKLALERIDLRAEDEALTVADPRDGGENLLPERQVLRLEIQQRHPRHRPRLHRITISGAPHNGRSLSRVEGDLRLAGVRIENQIHLLAAICRQIHHHGNPSAIRRVVERIHVLREELIRSLAVRDEHHEEDAIARLLPRLRSSGPD